MNHEIYCQDPKHRNEMITGLCLAACGLNPWVCSRCLVEKHGDHKEKYRSIEQVIIMAGDRVNQCRKMSGSLDQQYEDYLKLYEGAKKPLFEIIQFYEECINKLKNFLFYGNKIDQFIDKMKEKPKEQSQKQVNLMEQIIQPVQFQYQIYEDQVEILNNISQQFQKIGADLFDGRKYKDAARYLLIVSIVNNNNVQSHIDYGRCLIELNRQKQAQCCFDRAIKLQPGNWEPEFYKGISLKKSKNYEQAINSLKSSSHKYLALHHKLNQEIQLKIGSALIKQNKLEQGIAKFEKAITENSQYEEGYLAKIKYLTKQKRFDEAGVQCNNLIEKHPKSILAHFYKGIVLLSQYRTQYAQQSFEKVIELENEQPNLNSNHNYQEYGQLSQRFNQQTTIFSRASTHRLHQQFE